MPIASHIAALSLFLLAIPQAHSSKTKELAIQTNKSSYLLSLSESEISLEIPNGTISKIKVKPCNKTYLNSFFNNSANGYHKNEYEIFSSRDKRLNKYDIETLFLGKKTFWAYNSSTGIKLRNIASDFEKAKNVCRGTLR